MSNSEHLGRVRGSIGPVIVEFCNERNTFYAEELRDYVRRRCGYSAPASSDRILRDLRKKGLIDYKVLSRSKSLYQVIPIVTQRELDIEIPRRKLL